jgi:hypothetical protein
VREHADTHRRWYWERVGVVTERMVPGMLRGDGVGYWWVCIVLR